MKSKVFILITLPLMIFAAEWQSLNGPPLGRADDMSIGEYEGLWVIYAADKTHKLYKSTNEGEHWDSIPTAIPNPNIVNPTCVITDENNAQVVYIGKNDATPVWKSINGGEDWVERSTGITNTNPRCFAMHPNYANKIYLGCEVSSGQPAMFKTVDAGAHWTALDSFPDVWVKDIAIAADPRRGTTILAGCAYQQSKGIWRSTDGGETWTQTLADVDISSVEFASQFLEDIVYAGCGLNGVYKSTDGGVNWDALQGSPTRVKTIVTINANTVYVGTSGGVYLTTDGGVNWDECNGAGENKIFSEYINKMLLHPDDQNKIFTGANLAVYKTIDGGNHWSEITKGFKLMTGRSFGISGNHLYALGGANDVGEPDLFISRSQNYGGLWKCVVEHNTIWMSADPPYTISVSPNDPMFVLLGYLHWVGTKRCGQNGVIWKTSDGGLNWAYVYQPHVGQAGTGIKVYSVVINPLNNSYTYAGYRYYNDNGTQYGFMRSLDSGNVDTWFPASNGLGTDSVYSIAVNPHDGNMLYAGTASHGVYKSTNNADNWNPTALNDVDVNALTIDFDYPDTLYAGSEDPYGIYKTIDGGNTPWLSINNGLGNYLYIEDLEVDPSEPTIVYTLCKENSSATQSYVYCTVDRGGKWFNVSAGLPADKLTYDLDMDDDDSDPVYAGTENGVYAYTPDFNKSLVSSSNEATSFNTGKKMVRIEGTNEIWVTYESGGVSYAIRSTDAGQTWSKKMEIGQGYNPVININPDPEILPNKPRVVWWAKGDRDTLYFARYIAGNNWTAPSVLVTSNSDFGPPSFVIDTDDVGHLVYSEARSIRYTQFDIYNPIATLPELVGTGVNPSIGFMSGSVNPKIHVVWENNSTVLYRSRTIGGTWSDKETVFNNSNHPSLEIVGYVVHVVFEAFGDIFGRSAYYHNGEHFWSRRWTVCSTPNSSTYPVLTGGNACAWVEEIPGNFEIYFSYYDPEIGWVEPINISNTDECSNYPHITHKQTIASTTVYFTWTESNSAPYDIKFQTYQLSQDKGLAYYIADGGEEEASPFNLRREGYQQYGTEPYKRIDYDQEYLEYQFECLNPEKEYAGAVYLYQHGYANLPILAKVDNYEIGAITLPSDTLIILKHMLPTMLYEDSTINIKIFGNNAVSAILALYEYEVDSMGGGPQSSQSMPTQIGHLTLSIYPNPVKKIIGIEYNLPAKTDIKLSIFDVMGRLIKNIVSENQESGIFHKSFDITNLSQGVYFIRLNTCDKSLVEKVIFLK